MQMEIIETAKPLNGNKTCPLKNKKIHFNRVMNKPRWVLYHSYFSRTDSFCDLSKCPVIAPNTSVNVHRHPRNAIKKNISFML